MTHVPRRLRRGQTRGPRWVISVDRALTPEESAAVKAQWQAASRTDVAVVGPGVTIRRY